MLIKKILVTIILITALNSCKSPPQKKFIREDCKIYLEKYHKNVIEDYCFCDFYEISPDYMGPYKQGAIKEINYCLDMIGQPIDAYSDFTFFLSKWRSYLLKFNR